VSKSLKVLTILVLLTGLTYWLINRHPWSTFKGDLKEFSIKDTSAITKMFFADKKGNKVLLQKNEQHVWMIDNKFIADPDKINTLLSTMHDVEVRNPITEAEHNNVISILATQAIKAEFYQGDKLIKTIYVGSSTPDQVGTYMLIEGAEKPYITHIPGFVGYLTPRFISKQKLWKSKQIFNLSASEIKSVSVQYPMNMNQSFTIENGITPILKSSNTTLNADEKFLKYYLGSFRNLFFEGYIESSQAEKDSVHQITPFCIIQVTKSSGEKISLQVNIKAIDSHTKQQYDEKGNVMAYDTEKYFAFINDDKDMVLIQEYVFGKLFKTLDDILKIKS
jgi:Domain of unknown function (DUF4340)